jgi:hypothetical protein
MTTQSLMTKDERARAALEAAVSEVLRSPPPKGVSVTARDNHTGEPTLYAFDTMQAEKDIPDVSAQRRLTIAMVAALEKIDDRRVPYLYFGPREETAGRDHDASGMDEDAP